MSPIKKLLLIIFLNFIENHTLLHNSAIIIQCTTYMEICVQ